jgi:transcriptional regulator with XRE-family HTH domain
MVERDFDAVVGSNIARYRALLGVSQAEMARRVGMRQQQIGAIELGQRSLKYEEALAFAAALGVSVENLGDEPERVQLRAAFERRFRALTGVRNDVGVIADRLARVLLDLAELVGANRHAPADMQVPADTADEADRLLSTDWGAALNRDVVAELHGDVLPPTQVVTADDYIARLGAVAAAVTDWTPGSEPVRSFGEEDRHGATS